MTPRAAMTIVAAAAAAAAGGAALMPGPMWLVRCGGLFGLVGMLVLAELHHDTVMNYRALLREHRALAVVIKEIHDRARVAEVAPIPPATNQDRNGDLH